MGIVNRNNRTYESIKNNYNKVLPEQRMVFATSGKGKGLFGEQFIEKWKQATGGIVLCIADPKKEAEYSFVQYEPVEPYHVNQLKSDGVKPTKHSAKLYHPFSFNAPKGYLPDINFFTIPIKEMGREEWSILAEKSWDTESIRILLRNSETLGRNEGLIEFLLNVERLVGDKNKKKKKARDPKNFGLKVGGGTDKSITEIAGLLHPFKTNYFLRKDTCPHKLDWKKILTDTENYHVFLSMWLKDDKLQEFMVLSLLEQIIKNRHYAKKQILIVIPEILVLCPRNPQGYKFFLSQAITNKLSTMRSQGRGISSWLDSQNWSGTSDSIKGSATITYFGGLSTKDGEVVCKAMNYKRDTRESLQNMKVNHYLKAGEEDFGLLRGFLPRHMHKEPQYNWLEMYHRYYPGKEKRYSELIEFMRSESKIEEKIISDLIKKENEVEGQESERRRKNKESKDKPESKIEVDDKSKELKVEHIYEMRNNYSLSKKEKTWRAIGRKFKMSHLTAKKYYDRFVEKEKEKEEIESNPKSIKANVGEGIMPEEVESNYEDEVLKSLE